MKTMTRMQTTKTRMRKTRTRTTTGSSLSGLLLALVAVLVFVAPASAAKKPKKNSEASELSAVIAGTVFRPPGFALPGAEIEITPETEGKPKKWKVVSDARGEFALRVPPVPMKYSVNVKCNGYQPQHQTVAIEGE